MKLLVGLLVRRNKEMNLGCQRGKCWRKFERCMEERDAVVKMGPFEEVTFAVRPK